MVRCPRLLWGSAHQSLCFLVDSIPGKRIPRGLQVLLPMTIRSVNTATASQKQLRLYILHSERPSLLKRLLRQLIQSSPILYKLLSSTQLMVALYGAFSFSSCFEVVLPLFINITFGWGSSGTGIIFLTLTTPSLSLSTVGAISDRVGTRKVVLAGLMLCTIRLVLLALLKHTNVGQIILLCVLLGIIVAHSFLKTFRVAACEYSSIEIADTLPIYNQVSVSRLCHHPSQLTCSRWSPI